VGWSIFNLSSFTKMTYSNVVAFGSSQGPHELLLQKR